VIAEKIPFLLLGAVAGAVTMLAEQQVGALKTFEEFSFFTRLTNAVVAYGFYLYKTVWPFALSVHYPHPGAWPLSIVVFTLAVLAVTTFFTVQNIRSHPFLFVGWFWYFISLLPVIGLIQIGSHAYADRYTYIPLVGIFIAVVWGAGAWAERAPGRRSFTAALGVALTVAFVLISVQQVQHWQDAETLFRRAVSVTEQNYLAHNNLGAALSRQGRHGEAVDQFALALKIRPGYAEALFNMGAALAGQGRYQESLDFYGQVLARNPGFAEAHNNTAIAYARTGNLEQALAHFREAIRIRPDYGEARNNLRMAEKEKITKASGSSSSQFSTRDTEQ